MITRKFVAIVTATVALGMGPSSAGTPQLKASNRPVIDGPLSTSSDLQVCKKQVETNSSGTPIMRFKVCSGYYLFDPDKESGSNKDFGAFWFQVNADAINGYCARSITIDLDFTNGVHTRAPKLGTFEKAKKQEPFTTKLKVDAEGKADKPGTLKNTFKLLRGRMRSLMADENTFRLKWQGRAKDRLAFATGLELSWPEDDDLPAIQPRVSSFLDQDGC
jgi:hypothetical protein